MLWNALVSLFNLYIVGLGAILAVFGGPFGQIIYLITIIWNNLQLWLAAMGYGSAVDAIADNLGAVFEAWLTSFKWFYAQLVEISNLPRAFYNALIHGTSADSFGALMGCTGDGSFWCGFLAGLDLVNGVAAHSILYPIVIVAITLGTIYVLNNNFRGIWQWLSDDIFKI